MQTPARLALLVTALFLLGGCATSRSVLDIPPTKAEKAAPANGKEVYINTTVDKRLFEANPSSPNIPSLDPSEDANDQIKARSIARKRNTFGKALGDILLKDGQTVQSLTAESMRQAFTEKGYKVIDSREKATSETYIVDADIGKFWSWMNPGFAALTLSTEIDTEVRIKSPIAAEEKLRVAVKASDNYQTGMESNWIEVVSKALRAYIDELKSKLK